jgi:hypothetical protein
MPKESKGLHEVLITRCNVSVQYIDIREIEAATAPSSYRISGAKRSRSVSRRRINLASDASTRTSAGRIRVL